MKIIIPDYIDIPETAKHKIRELGGEIHEDTPTDQDIIIDRIKDAEIITANYLDVTSEVIDQAPKLKYVIVPAVGYEWVDYAYAKSKGIQTINCPTFNSRAVAEHAIALMMTAKRKLVEATLSVRDGNWSHENFKGTETQGKKLGLMGYGRIGKQIEAMAQGLGMEVTHINSTSAPEEIDSMLQGSDAVCMCLPLNDRTKHILDERRLGLLQPHCVLVNVGRGATIDQTALIKTLQSGKIAGAGLDVFEGEPLTGKPSNEIVEIANLPNVVATPHMAYNTAETAARLGEELLQNIQACQASQPVNIVG